MTDLARGVESTLLSSKLAVWPTDWIEQTLHIEVSAVTFGFVRGLSADAPVLSVLFELANSAAGLPGGLVWLLTGDSLGEARLLPNAVTRISDDGLV